MACAVAAGALWLASPAATVSAADCANADQAPTATNLKAIAAAVVCLHNADRAQQGLPRLRPNRGLRTAALTHATDMVRTGYFEHTSPSGQSFVDRIRRSGYLHGSRGWTIGENLAWGTSILSTARGVQDAWMRSHGHRANILNPAYRDIGIGIALGVPFPDLVGATFAIELGTRSVNARNTRSHRQLPRRRE